MAIDWDDIASKVVDAVGHRHPLKTTIPDLAGDLQRAKAAFDRQTASGHSRVTQGDIDAVLQNARRVRKLREKLASLRRRDAHSAALRTASIVDQHILGDKSLDTFLKRLDADLSKYVALVELFGSAAALEQRGARLEFAGSGERLKLISRDEHDRRVHAAQEWWKLFNLDELSRRRLAALGLIRRQIPEIYTHHFGRRFGISRRETKGVQGPAVRFAVAVLEAFGICHERGRLLQPRDTG